MSNILTNIEQAAIKDFKAAYAKLQPEARAELAKSISWAERNIGYVVLVTAVVSFAAGYFI